MKETLKRWYLIMVCLFIMLWLPTVRVSAASIIASGTCGSKGDNLTWELNSDGILNISGEGQMASYNTSYTAPWYNYRTSVKKVVINEGVTDIGSYAFNACDVMTEITFPDTLTQICSYAFYSCDGLKDVTFPESLVTIGKRAFGDCDVLTQIRIPAGVTLGEGAFATCKSLKNVSNVCQRNTTSKTTNFHQTLRKNNFLQRTASSKTGKCSFR